MAKDMKCISTKQLLWLARRAVEANFNRKLPQALLDDLDPKGSHILSFFMIHDLIEGQPAEPHVRANTWLKIKSQELAIEDFMLDISTDDWDSLPRIVSGPPGRRAMVLPPKHSLQRFPKRVRR